MDGYAHEETIPWLWVFIHGQPRPQGNLTGFVAGGKVVLRHSDNRLVAWRGYAASLLAGAAPEPLGDQPVSVRAIYYIRRPKSHLDKNGEPKKGAPTYVKTRPDLDKYLRALLDAIQISGIIKDDSQVVKIDAMKLYGRDEGVAVQIEPILSA